MTPTSDERREVAATLRDAKRKCDGRGYPWTTDDLILAIGYEHDYEADNGIFDRLADLIDPTCHMVDTDHEYEDSIRCDVCQMTFNRPWEPFKFCPNCGARITGGANKWLGA